jgi:hypothetical protein
MNSQDIFRVLTAALEQAQISYMVVGSFASNLYGTGRSTQDIDLVISARPDQIRELVKAFPRDLYYFDLDAALDACRRRSMFNILDMAGGWKVDFIFEKLTEYHQNAFQRRTATEIGQVPLFASTAEDTIVSKLEWANMGGSLRQIEDVAGVLKVQQGSLDFAYIEKWVKQLGLASEWEKARKTAGLP